MDFYDERKDDPAEKLDPTLTAQKNCTQRPSHKLRIGFILDILFVLCLIAFLLFGGIKAIVDPKTVNYYENRTANQMPVADSSGILLGTFQDQVEAALRDQVLLAQTMEAGYLYLDSTIQIKLIQPFIDANPDRYISVLGLKTFGGTHLIYDTYSLSDGQTTLDSRIENINQAILAYPDLEFYLYYIEKDTDIDFSTGEKVGIREYLQSRINVEAHRFGVFSIDNFADFSQYFFRTDHHWNCYGSYQGYCQVLSMLDPQAVPLKPVKALTLNGTFSGSKANTIGAAGVFQETFPVYQFDYPPMEITINGQSVFDYGNQEGYQNGTETAPLSYGSYYGGDYGEIILSTNKPDQENLLMIGESYDNAILKLLAAHYNEIYSIDLRYYENAFGEPFQLAQYAEAHHVKKVLFIGSGAYFLTDTFNLEE